MRNQAGALEQNRSKAQPNLRTGTKYQRRSPLGPTSNPLEQGSGKWAGPGWYGRTAPSSSRPHVAQAVHSMLGEAVACGTYLKYMSNRPSSSYKRSPPPHIQEESYTFEKKKKGYTHSISF